MENAFQIRMHSLLQEEYPAFIEALQKDSVKGFYTNPLKSDCIAYLDSKYIHHHPYIHHGYTFDYQDYPLGKHPYFACGTYYIQEPSAMVVGDLLDVKEDDYILDMCGAPGGKTCQVASKLSLEGLMITNDITSNRATILSSNVERFGLENTIVTNCDPVHFSSIFPGYFDKIILDAPCSGEGMFRKLDQAITTWSVQKVIDCAIIQRNLIDHAYSMLKEDGILIYSTCTYSLEENEQQVQYCIDELGMEPIRIPLQNGMQPGINQPTSIRLYPHCNHGEGHFVAMLQKKQSTKDCKVKRMQTNCNKEQIQLVTKFYHDYLNIPVPSHLYNSNNHIYAFQSHFPDLKGVRVLRNGLYLGECKKGRFEPSLSLAHTLHKKEVKQYYQFSANSKEVQDYLLGLTLEGSNNKGYGIIFVDDFALSFYKESNNQIKNLYPKGLRIKK